MNKKIIIFGGGISGLTIAHELNEKGFNVEIYEKDSINGGMARTFRDNNNVPTEHSWRGYGPFYYNAFDILQRIPLMDKDEKSKNVEAFNNDKVYSQSEVALHNKDNDAWIIYKNGVYNITDFVKKHPGGKIIRNAYGKDLEAVWKEYNVGWHMSNSNIISGLEKYKIGKLKEDYKNYSNDSTVRTVRTVRTVKDNLREFDMVLLKNKIKENRIKINKYDYPYLVYLFSKSILSNNRREEYYKTKLCPLLDNKVFNDTKSYLLDFLSGPGFGFDKNSISLCHYALFSFRQLLSGKKWNVTNAPTNEAWFDVWTKYLKKKGVKIYNNSELTQIVKNKNDNKKIDYCIVNNKIIKGDEYIICINPNNVEDICERSDLKDLAKIHSKINTINNQISFRLGFNKKLDFPKKRLGFVLMDSPYNITFYPQEDHWDSDVSLGMNGKIKSLWSGTIIFSYIPGSLTGKSATSLKKEQLLDEIVHQMLESKDLKSIVKQNIDKKDIIHREIFDDWVWNGNNLESKNKKWVNNVYNEKHRPDNKTNYNNLYLGGSHTKTEIGIWSMEGAVESGKNTSNYILNKYKLKECYQHKHELPLIIEFIGKLDDILYALYLPSIVDVCLIILLFFIYRKLTKSK